MIAGAITDWLIRQQAIESEDKELYEYAIQSLYYSIAPIILSLIIGVFLGKVGQGFILSIPICLIRKFSGGYHARYSWLCTILSVGALLCCMLFLPYFYCGVRLFWVTVVSLLSLGIMSPIDSENRPLDVLEKKRYKRGTIIVAVCCEVVFLIVWACGQSQIAVCIAMGIVVSALLQMPCIPRLMRERITKDNK